MLDKYIYSYNIRYLFIKQYRMVLNWIAQYPGFELERDHPAPTVIESFIQDEVGIDCKRSVENPQEWIKTRERLLEKLSSESREFIFLWEWKRYVAFKINWYTVIVKILFTETLPTELRKKHRWNHTEQWEEMSKQRRLFSYHIEEHEIVKKWMRRLVPDTLFINSNFPQIWPTFNKLQIDHNDTFLIVQDYIKDWTSIMNACKDFRAENTNFLNDLTLFLEKYDNMRHIKWVIPEITSLWWQNALIWLDWKLSIIDTNSLIRVKNNDWTLHPKYAKRFKARWLNTPDSLMSSIEQLIRRVEQWHLPWNPQG